VSIDRLIDLILFFSKAFWRIREGVPEALNTFNAMYKVRPQPPRSNPSSLPLDI